MDISSPDFRGRRVTVMGLGRFGGGVGVTRWLARQGARVVVSDQASAEELRESILALAGLDLELHLGGHDEKDLAGCELLVVNPAVPFDSPYVAAARAAGVATTTEINLFLSRCPAPVVGITGSAGKSTTTAMAGAILAEGRPTHVGGNIGRSLLDELDDIRPDHVVVLELSSFQLAYLPLLGRSPGVAVVTNLQPNHLDRHGTMDEYGSAKKNIFRFHGPEDVLVLNRDDPKTAIWADEARGRVEFFSAADGEPFELPLPGRHNQANAQAAWAAARALGANRDHAQRALRHFQGLPHRLQLVHEHNGVRCYNDSKCTTPEEGVVAVEAFEPRTAIVIVGGYDKKIDLEPYCRALALRAKAVVCTGQTGEAMARLVEQASGTGAIGGALPWVVRVQDFAAAVRAAHGLAGRGDVLLLAPGCASYDQFKNYQQRGDLFTDVVRKLCLCKP